MFLERLDDDPRAVGRRLDQGAIDLLGRGRKRRPDEEAAHPGVDQHGSVAVPPVQRQQPRLADPEGGSLLLEQGVEVDAPLASLAGIWLRRGVLHEPPEMVADARLAGLVPEEAGQDPVLDVAAHARHRLLVPGQHHVARGGAHDHHHAPGLDHRGSGHSDMGIDVRHRHGGPRTQSRPGGSLLGQPAGSFAHGHEVPRHARVDDIGKARIERGEVVVRRETVPLRPHRLVAGRADVAGLPTGQLPDDPVRCLEEPLGTSVDVRRLVEDLERLGEEPLGADLPAIAIQPGLAARARDVIDPIRFGLGGVVLPELDPGVRLGAQIREEAQRGAVGGRREHRARGEVDADADDVVRSHAGRSEDVGDRRLEDPQVVLGILERPLGRKHDVAVLDRQPMVDHAVRIRMDGGREDGAVADVDEDRAAGLRPEVDTDGVAAQRPSPVRDRQACVAAGFAAGSRDSAGTLASR